MEKSIQPISSWKNGEQVSANKLSLYSINDDLATSASFYYQLKSETTVTDGEGVESTTSIQVAEGNVSLTGEDYTNWSGSNDQALTIAAAKLNLTII